MLCKELHQKRTLPGKHIKNRYKALYSRYISFKFLYYSLLVLNFNNNDLFIVLLKQGEDYYQYS